MYDLINNISKRCYDAATKRGKDTSCVGCLQYLAVELREYWDAVDKGRNVPDFAETVQKANALPDAEFNALYAAKIHNTAAEELADVIIASLSVAGKLGIDIDAAVRGKMEINKARPWKHRKEEKPC